VSMPWSASKVLWLVCPRPSCTVVASPEASSV
jgi:hypothetical protein